MIDVLKFIKEKMEAAGINYQFGEWKGAVKYPYFVGEYTTDDYVDEHKRHQERLFLTDGRETTDWNFSTLIKIKRSIQKPCSRCRR